MLFFQLSQVISSSSTGSPVTSALFWAVGCAVGDASCLSNSSFDLSVSLMSNDNFHLVLASNPQWLLQVFSWSWGKSKAEKWCLDKGYLGDHSTNDVGINE